MQHRWLKAMNCKEDLKNKPHMTTFHESILVHNFSDDRRILGSFTHTHTHIWMCYILTFDRAINQRFFYTGCTCVNKRKQHPYVDSRNTDDVIKSFTHGYPRHIRSVLASRPDSQELQGASADSWQESREGRPPTADTVWKLSIKEAEEMLS